MFESILKTIIIYTLIFVCHFTQAQELTPELFLEIQKISEQIRSQYPAHQYQIIGLGRSATPITSYLKLKYGQDAAISFPLSNFRLTVFDKDDRLTMELLGERIEEFINLADQRDIVLVDYSQSGQSLLGAQYCFQKYLKKKKNLKEVHSIALQESNSKFVGQFHHYKNIFNIEKTQIIQLGRKFQHLEDSFIGQIFDHVSEYGYSPLGKVIGTGKKEAHRQFLETLRSFLFETIKDCDTKKNIETTLYRNLQSPQPILFIAS